MAIKAIVVNNKVNAITVGRPGPKGIPGAAGTPVISAGMLAEVTITDNLNGTISVAEGQCNLYVDDIFTAPLITFTIPALSFTLTDNRINYLVVNYLGGSPAYRTTPNLASINGSNIVPVSTIYRNGTELHFLSWDSPGSGLADKLWFKTVKTERFIRETGLAISTAGTRNVVITAGAVWNGVKRNALLAFNSATDLFKLRYHIAGVWSNSTITQFNNFQYDNGTNLVTADANKYLVNWIYKNASGVGADIVLGTTQYNTVAAAQAAQEPLKPEYINTHSLLVGRIIVQKDAAVASAIETAFGIPFAGSPATIHNELSGLNDGDYKHLTTAEYAALGGGGGAIELVGSFTTLGGEQSIIFSGLNADNYVLKVDGGDLLAQPTTNFSLRVNGDASESGYYTTNNHGFSAATSLTNTARLWTWLFPTNAFNSSADIRTNKDLIIRSESAGKSTAGPSRFDYNGIVKASVTNITQLEIVTSQTLPAGVKLKLYKVQTS